VTKSDSTLGVLTLSEADLAVVRLFDECRLPLHRYVGSFGIGSLDTEDVVQDVFLSLFRHLQQGKSQRNLKGWLFTVAHNLALKQRTRARRHRDHFESSARAEPIDPAISPERELVLAERQARLLRVLRALPELDRRCLYLRAEGSRYREIAELTGLSLGAVSKSLTRSFLRMENADEC
jgi:RNA polymerase sigma-70 factor (ECF subfamily)